jgi:hypothetical protein
MSKAQSSSTEAVKVMVRVRPMNTSEKEKGCKSVLKVDRKSNQIEIFKENENSKVFAFD